MKGGRPIPCHAQRAIPGLATGDATAKRKQVAGTAARDAKPVLTAGKRSENEGCNMGDKNL